MASATCLLTSQEYSCLDWVTHLAEPTTASANTSMTTNDLFISLNQITSIKHKLINECIYLIIIIFVDYLINLDNYQLWFLLSTLDYLGWSKDHSHNHDITLWILIAPIIFSIISCHSEQTSMSQYIENRWIKSIIVFFSMYILQL